MDTRAGTPEPARDSFGYRLHDHRKQLGFTLVELARRSGVSAAMLSEVERNRKSPSLRVASRIAEGLECAVSDLLSQDLSGGITIQARRQRRRLVDPSSGIERHVLAPRLLSHGIELVWYVVPKGSSSGQFPPHRAGVVAHVTIVKGELESKTPRRRYRLRAGDSMTYPAGVAHEFKNAGSATCEFVLIVDASRQRQAPIR